LTSTGFANYLGPRWYNIHLRSDDEQYQPHSITLNGGIDYNIFQRYDVAMIGNK